MAKMKFDGVVEAVRYQSEGKVDWVRAYVRRGPTFSDRVLLQRQALIDAIKLGKKFVTGKRVPYRASTFEIGEPIQVLDKSGRSVLVVGGEPSERDSLAGVPRI